MKKVVIVCLLLSLSISSCFSKELFTNALIKKVNAKYGKFTTNRFLLLKKRIKQAKNKSDVEKLTVINNFFNKVKYSSDSKVWKRKDYWATPFEFLAKDKGDSEDFVFAKYFTLVNDLKLNPNKFQFTYVKLKKKKVSYMVLTYYKTPKSVPLILDTINYKVLPATKRSDIQPIYSFSARSAGLSKNKNSKFKAKQSLKFRDILRKIKEERI